MQQHIIFILVTLLFTVLFIFLVLIVEPIILEDYYPPNLPDTLTMEQWIESFQKWALICVGAALVAIVLWYVFAQRVFKGNNEKSYGKRGLWGFLFVLPLAAIIVSILSVEQAESSLWLAYLFFIGNGLLPYYFSTLLCSPIAVKYTPIGAKGIRSICPW